jgi:hypothetical protein
MKIFNIQTSEVLQGDFNYTKLNLMVVFQVNCPGCFQHALPQAIQLHEEYSSKGLNVLGLSTAFENFDLNTVENTKALLNENILVGETKKAFILEGKTSFPLSIPFPVAMDKLLSPADFANSFNIEFICQEIPKYESLSKQEQEILQLTVKQHFLQFEKVSYTFSINQLRGTPSWILFNEKQEILAQWLGHQSIEKVQKIIDLYLIK